MASGGDTRYHYSSGNASIYDSLEIKGTTYEIGFNHVASLLGDLRGKTFIDFGTGTGKSAAFLAALGAKKIYAFDRDSEMLSVSRLKEIPRVSYLPIGESLTLPPESVDGAIALDVFIEIRSLDEMRAACLEIARVLRRGYPFIMMSSSPMAFGHTFKSFRYPPPSYRESGALNVCVVTAPDGDFEIVDTYWSEADYIKAITFAGLEVVNVDYPPVEVPSEWSTDEPLVPPHIIIKAIKR